MRFLFLPLFLSLLVSCFSAPQPPTAQVPPSGDPHRWVFLLIGQSNMVGTPRPQAADLSTDPRIRVMGYADSGSPLRIHEVWTTAYPPLHNNWAGVGPGDWFAKTLIEAVPEGVSIDLVPCAIAGVDIDMFRKGVVSSRRGEFFVPPDDHWKGAYDWVVERARLAQRTGVIKGILFHQGESNAGSPSWPGKVAEMVADLRSDLGLGEVPFLAGELLYSGPCAGHNAQVARLPGLVPGAVVVSAAGLEGQDRFHFDLAGQRELGRRYARALIPLLKMN